MQDYQDSWLNAEFIAEDSHKAAVMNAAAMAQAQFAQKTKTMIENIQLETENAPQ